MLVRDDPKIVTGRAVHGVNSKASGKGAPKKDEEELRGDLLLQDLWTQGMDGIHNMHVVNTDVFY